MVSPEYCSIRNTPYSRYTVPPACSQLSLVLILHVLGVNGGTWRLSQSLGVRGIIASITQLPLVHNLAHPPKVQLRL